MSGKSLILLVGVVAATAERAAADEPFRTAIRPFITKYCIDCHGESKPRGGIKLSNSATAGDIIKNRKIWESVLDVVETAAMPPADRTVKPDKRERAAVVAWLEKRLFELDCDNDPDPGRVTIRRLNRTEYHNTIQDLFGLEIAPAKDFPADDVGEGFDNIGDVLSLSPLLMEKYLAAGKLVADQVMEREDRVSAVTTRLERKQLQISPKGSLDKRGTWWLYSNGEVFGRMKFPGDGTYIIRVRASAQQAGKDRAKMAIRIDGKQVASHEVRDNLRARVYPVRLKIAAGEHRIAAAFLNDYFNKKARNRRDRDRNLGIWYIEAEGPLEAKQRAGGALFSSWADNPGEARSVAKQTFVKLLPRVFRRPVGEGEIARYVSLVQSAMSQGAGFKEAAATALQAMLISPHFLFRVERDARPDDPEARHQLSQFELASRLSYFLWSSMPDETLFQLARDKQLGNPDVIEEQVARMLQDPKSESLVKNFAAQWLNLRNLDEITPDARDYPSFSTVLRSDMKTETELFCREVFQQNRSVLDFIDGKFSYWNERLARHYGDRDQNASGFRRVSLTGTSRRGVLTHASILTLTSNPTETSPVKRGKWILENILDAPPPPPPPDVPELDEAKKAIPNASLREQLELHRSNPVCASCHIRMDALGFGFENFDVIGRWRTEVHGQKIRANASLPDGGEFTGPVELVEILRRKRTEFTRCLTKKLLTYALGRGLVYYDRCAVDSIVEKTEKNGHRFYVLVSEIAKSAPFQMRRGDGGKP